MKAVIIFENGITYSIESIHTNTFIKEVCNKIKIMSTEEEEIKQINILLN